VESTNTENFTNFFKQIKPVSTTPVITIPWSRTQSTLCHW